MENDVEISVKCLQVSYSDVATDVVVLQGGANSNGGGSFKVPHDFCKVGDDITIIIKHKSPIYRPGAS